MNVYRKILLFCLLVLISQTYAFGANEHYLSAISNLNSEYQSVYKLLNDTIEKCSVRQGINLDYTLIAKKIPTKLSKRQLKAALLTMKNQFDTKCISGSVGLYLIKAAEIKQVEEIILNKKSELIALNNFNLVLDEINETKKLLFSKPPSYFEVLADYQSISQIQRQKIESIKELKSNYNLVKLLDALDKI